MQRSAKKRQSFFRIRFGKSVTLLEVPKTRHTLSVLAIFAAIVLIVYPVLTLTEPVLIDQDGRYILGNESLSAEFSFKKYHYAAVIMLLLAIIRRPGLTAKVLEKSFKSGISTVMFFFIILSIAINSMIIGSTNAVFQTITLLIYFISFLVFFSASEEDRKYFFQLISMAFFVYIIISVILYWPPQNRWLGGIHPNIYSQPLIFFAAFVLFMTKKFRLIGLPLAIFMALSVSSRYALVSIALVLFLYFSLKLIAKSSISVYALTAFIGLPLLAGITLELEFIREALQLDDQARGLGSGGTGRLEMIKDHFLVQFEAKPITGYGFRQRGEYYTTHNAILNMILEHGIIISSMLLLYIFTKYISLAYHVVINRSIVNYYNIEQRMIFCIYSVVLFSSLLMPQMINFGDAYGVFVILCLAYPVKYLRNHEQ